MILARLKEPNKEFKRLLDENVLELTDGFGNKFSMAAGWDWENEEYAVKEGETFSLEFNLDSSGWLSITSNDIDISDDTSFACPPSEKMNAIIGGILYSLRGCWQAYLVEKITIDVWVPVNLQYAIYLSISKFIKPTLPSIFDRGHPSQRPIQFERSGDLSLVLPKYKAKKYDR